jgi:hypothetical protein
MDAFTQGYDTKQWVNPDTGAPTIRRGEHRPIKDLMSTYDIYSAGRSPGDSMAQVAAPSPFSGDVPGEMVPTAPAGGFAGALAALSQPDMGGNLSAGRLSRRLFFKQMEQQEALAAEERKRKAAVKMRMEPRWVAPTEGKPLTTAAKAQADYNAGRIDKATHDRIIASIGKPGVNVNMGGNKQGEIIAGYYGNLFVGLQEAAARATQDNLQLNRVGQLMQTLDPGILEPLSQKVKATLKSAGVDLESWGLRDNVGAAEAMDSLAVRFTLEGVQQTKGAVSNTEMDEFSKMGPSLGKSKEGIALIIEMRRGLNKRAKEAAKLARTHWNEHKNMDGFEDVLDQYHQENPLFTQDLRSRIDSVAPGAGAVGKPAAKSGTEWLKQLQSQLPPGWTLRRVGGD